MCNNPVKEIRRYHIFTLTEWLPSHSVFLCNISSILSLAFCKEGDVDVGAKFNHAQQNQK